MKETDRFPLHSLADRQIWSRKLQVRLVLPRRLSGCCRADRETSPRGQKRLPEDMTLKLWPKTRRGPGRAFQAEVAVSARQHKTVHSGVNSSGGSEEDAWEVAGQDLC